MFSGARDGGGVFETGVGCSGTGLAGVLADGTGVILIRFPSDCWDPGRGDGERDSGGLFTEGFNREEATF